MIKQIIPSIIALCFTMSLGAQELISKIPSNASAVVTIKGRNITQLMSVDDFSSSKLGQMMIKEISKETDEKITTIEGLGLDLEKDFHYFLEVNDNTFYNVFLIPLKNSQGFLSLLPEREKDKIVSEGAISYLQEEYDGMTMMWNDNTMIMVFAVDQSSEDYFYDDYSYNVETVEEVVEAMDAAEAVEDSEAVEEMEEVVEEAADAVEEIVEEAIEETVIESTENEVVDYYDSPAYKKQEADREKRRQEWQAKKDQSQKELAANTLKRAKQIFGKNNATNSILKNTSYMKSIGKNNAEATVWVNDFMKIYEETMLNSMSMLGAGNPYEFMNLGVIYDGISVAGKLDFEEDKATFKMAYTMNDEMAKLYKPMYNGKFNKNFLNYLNEDKLLGYWNLNTSTEGTLVAYPKLLDQMFKSDSKNTISNSVSLASNLVSILLDEEAAATIVRGDMLLALTDLREQTVTYTDYEYDEDYNYKEIEKTKTETIPDFIFMFTSEQEKLFRSLMRIGVNEGEISYENGIYEIVNMRSSSPFEIFAMYKDNTVFIGSSKQHLVEINSGTYVSKLSKTHKTNLTRNSTSMYVNGKKIVSEIPVDSYPNSLKGEIGFITQNTEDIQINFSRVKGNSMKGEMIWATPEVGHKNSFAYFINMIDALMD